MGNERCPHCGRVLVAITIIAMVFCQPLFARSFPKGIIKFNDGITIKVKNISITDNIVTYKYNNNICSHLTENISFIKARGKTERTIANIAGGGALVVFGGLTIGSIPTSTSLDILEMADFTLLATGLSYVGGRIIGYAIDPWKIIYPSKAIYDSLTSLYEHNATYGFIYPSVLVEVGKPNEAVVKWGEGSITKGDSTKTYMGTYKDGLMSISFNIDYHQILFNIINISDHKIKINWDNSCYVSPYGVSMRIIHENIKLNDRYLPQMPSVILRNTSYSDLVLPADNAFFAASSWNYHGLIYALVFGEDMPSRLPEANAIKNKQYSLMLHLEVDGSQYDYVFSFTTVGNPIYRVVDRIE